MIARPRSDGSARHGTAWRSAGRTRTMSWAASASGSTRRRSSSSTASRAARRRAASTVAPAPLVRVATRPRKAAVARSAARRISTTGPSSTTAERRPVITTATRSPPAAAIDTSSRPPSDSRRSPSRRRVARAFSVRGDSRIHRSCSDRSSRAWRDRSSSDGDPSSSARVSSTALARSSASSSTTADGTLGTAGRGSAVPARARSIHVSRFHGRGSARATRMARSTMSRACTSMAALASDTPSVTPIAFELVERGAEMTPRCGAVANHPRGRRRGVARTERRVSSIPTCSSPRRGGGGAALGDVDLAQVGGDGRREDRAATSPLALPTAASSVARASSRSRSDIPSSRASIARRACISSSSAARWRPPDPISANVARACSAASAALVASPSSRAAWARSSQASAAVARSPSAPSRRKASSANSSASAVSPADSNTSALETSGNDASWPSRKNAWQFSSRIVSACGSWPRLAAVQPRL